MARVMAILVGFGELADRTPARVGEALVLVSASLTVAVLAVAVVAVAVVAVAVVAQRLLAPKGTAQR